jgi:hypothetical protein
VKKQNSLKEPKKLFMAINEITGKVIKTSPQNSTYAEGWEKVFAKKSANEWLKTMPDVQMMDPDGWRQNDDVDMDTPIKWSDFQKRLNISTILCKIPDV